MTFAYDNSDPLYADHTPSRVTVGDEKKLDGYEVQQIKLFADATRKHAPGWISALSFGADPTGAADSQPAIKAAVDRASALGGGIVYLPRGTYKLLSAVPWKTKVSLWGDGPGATVIKMVGDLFSAILDVSTGSPSAPFEDCTFRDFEIDGSGLTRATPDVDGKGIFIFYLRRAWFENLYIHDCVGTGLGTDYLVDSVIHGVVSNNNGRNWDGVTFPIGQSGIGIGTGGFPSTVENVTISDCHTSGNGNYGIFVEDQDLDSAGFARGARIVNCYAEGNRIGFGNVSGVNALFLGCDAHGNSQHGFYLNGRASGDRVVACVAKGNGVHGIYAEVHHGGLVVADTCCVENSRNGLRVEAQFTDPYCDRVSVNGGEFVANGEDGVHLQGSNKGIVGYRVIGSTIKDNGTALVSGARNGIMLAGILTDGQITGNWIGNSASSTAQGVGINSYGHTISGLSIVGNTFARGIVSPAVIVSGSDISIASNPGFNAAALPETLTYSASIAVAAGGSDKFAVIVPNNTTAFTIQSPSGGAAGQKLTFHIKNASGGSLGTVTWGSNYRTITGGSWSAASDSDTPTARPANGKGRLITFRCNGAGVWFEEARSAADVTN